MSRRVVITGIGLVSSLGIGTEANWKALLIGTSGVGRVTKFDVTGYAAQIAAEVQEKCFWHLDQPVMRIAAKNTPVPTSPALEDATIPQPAEIAQTLREVARA